MSHKPNIPQLVDHDLCTGCGVCVNSCPSHSIIMKEDAEGFLQPHIYIDSCINCGKCERSCPIISPITKNDELETLCYAAINKNDIVRKQSSSGGVFFLLAKNIIQKGGVVFGARFDEEWNVVHGFAENLHDVKALMGSKYVQSNIGTSFLDVQCSLQEDRWVLFSGTPCQVVGLKKFLGKDYSKLLLVDMICHGVPSPGVWRKYLREICQKDNILGVSFRDKRNGWKNYHMHIIGEKLVVCQHHNENLYMRGFLNNLFLRRSCYDCQYKTIHRHSDITLADFWGVEQIAPSMNDDMGTSLAFIHSVKGQEFFTVIKNQLSINQQETRIVLVHNPSMHTSVSMTTSRKKFFRYNRFVKVEKSIELSLKSSVCRRIIRKIKRLLNLW